MGQLFYLVVNGQQTGPFTIDELKLKNIQHETLVWTEGMDNWTKAENVPLLNQVLRSIPPSFPDTENYSTYQSAPPLPTNDTNSNDPYFGYELALRRERFFAAIIETIVLFIPTILLSGYIAEENYPYSLGSILSGGIISIILGAIFYSVWGGNIGHKIMGLKVISSENGEVQKNAKTGAIREGLKYIFSLIVIPVVWLLWDNNRQNLYDKVVNTYVVRKKVGLAKKLFRGCFLFVLTSFFIIFLLLWGSVYFYIDGIPTISNYVVEKMPASVDTEVGRELRRKILTSAPIDTEKTVLLQNFYTALGYNTKTKVYVVKADEFNAFALPDNSIFVFDQVLKDVGSYSELAALLGHEYIHIKNRHGIKTLAHALSRELLASFLTGGDNSDKFIHNANQLLELSNSRDFEREADKGGIKLMAENHINLNGMTELFKRIEKLPIEKNVPTYLSTHPDIEDRLEATEEEIKKKQNNFVTNEELESLFHQLITFKEN